jgi:hypothetical protein
MLSKYPIAVYIKDHTNPINKKAQLMISMHVAHIFPSQLYSKSGGW